VPLHRLHHHDPAAAAAVRCSTSQSYCR